MLVHDKCTSILMSRELKLFESYYSGRIRKDSREIINDSYLLWF